MFLQSTSSRRVTSESGTALSSAEPARNTSSDTVLASDWVGSASAGGSGICVAPAPIACAMPFGSMIMITDPSPRMVLPENIGMRRSLVDIGLTTISSVWNTASTTIPNVWLPT